MYQPGRKYTAGSNYRYGFNGKENDGETGWQDYGMRISDNRLGRFLSVDPITASYPKLTPYQFASNCPIAGIDLDGLEFKLTITDPTFGMLFQTMLQSLNFVSIYDMRRLTFNALHSTMSEEKTNQIAAANYGDNVGDKSADISGASATLTYDKDLPRGVTVEYNTANYAVMENGQTKITQIFQKNVLIPNGKVGDGDHNYPVDVKTINSPEFKDYYKDYDFIGTYGNKNVNLFFTTTSESEFSGYLKGSGYVQYTSGSGGASGNKPWGGSYSTGVMCGKSSSELKADFYPPSILEGFGTQAGFGLSSGGIGAEGGKWYSWNSLSDITTPGKKATFSGWYGGASWGLDLKKLIKKLPSPSSGASGGAHVSISALAPRRSPNVTQ